LNHKKQKFHQITTFAQNLISSQHPAAEDIRAHISTLKTETEWLHRLMHILSIHINHLQQYEKFTKEYSELNTYLNTANNKLDLFIEKINKKVYSDDLINQFNIFKHSFQIAQNVQEHLDKLENLAKEMPAYKMRKMSLSHPHDHAEILVSYSLIDFELAKGEMCQIIDNLNQVKWEIMSIQSKRKAFVPSVCFILKGPDSELMEMIVKYWLN
jgi:hypothetical protein